MRQQCPLLCWLKALARQHILAKGSAILLLLIMAGCRIPGLSAPDPGPVMPGDFNGVTSYQNSGQVGIGEFFNDPVLTQLVTQRLAQNQELKIRNQEIQIASNEIMARRGEYLPFVRVGARGGFDRTSKYTPLGAAEDQLTFPGGGEFPDPLPNVKLFADLLWHVDIWRQLRNSRDAAMQRYIAAVEDRNFLVTQLVAETAENYFELSALDKRLVFLNQTIAVQQRSLEVATAQKAAARGTELAVQRFLAEVRKNESQRPIISQDIIEAENRINFLVGSYPQPIERMHWDFINLDSRPLNVGIPAQLLQNRRDIRAAERELAAAGLDVLVARANFYPQLDITAGVGFEAFSPKYLFEPESFIANAAGELVAPLINKQAIRAEYLTANARQLQAVYDYQRTVLNAFIEVVNAMQKAENYRRSVVIKQQQVKALEDSVNIANDLFQGARAEYVDVLFSQRDLLEARIDLIETKLQQLTAIIRAYQALGGGYLLSSSGTEFAELFCEPWLAIQPYEDVPPPTLAPPPAPAAGNATELPDTDIEPLPPPRPNSTP